MGRQEPLDLSPISASPQSAQLALKRTELPQQSQNLGQVVHRLAARQELSSRIPVTGRRVGDVDPQELASAAQPADQVATAGRMRAKPLTDLGGAQPLRGKCLSRGSRIEEDPLSGRKGAKCIQPPRIVETTQDVSLASRKKCAPASGPNQARRRQYTGRAGFNTFNLAATSNQKCLQRFVLY